jgi:hypothetical protein
MQQQQAQPAACALLVKRSAGAPESTRAQRSTNSVQHTLGCTSWVVPQPALLRQHWAVVHFADPCLASAFPQVQPAPGYSEYSHGPLPSAACSPRPFRMVRPAVQCMPWPIRTAEYSEQARRAEYLPALPAEQRDQPMPDHWCTARKQSRNFDRTHRSGRSEP